MDRRAEAISAPIWSYEETGGFVRNASAFVGLDRPLANPHGPCTILFLDVSEDEHLVEFRWRFAISEEDSGFGEAEFGSGRSSDLEEAKAACWEEVVDFLHREGYSDCEIVDSVWPGEWDQS